MFERRSLSISVASRRCEFKDMIVITVANEPPIHRERGLVFFSLSVSEMEA